MGHKSLEDAKTPGPQGLASGYLNLPQETKTKFIKTPQPWRKSQLSFAKVANGCDRIRYTMIYHDIL